MAKSRVKYREVPTFIAHQNLDGELVNTPTEPEEGPGTDGYKDEHLREVTVSDE